jgi:hypothetical protein
MGSTPGIDTLTCAELVADMAALTSIAEVFNQMRGETRLFLVYRNHDSSWADSTDPLRNIWEKPLGAVLERLACYVPPPALTSMEIVANPQIDVKAHQARHVARWKATIAEFEAHMLQEMEQMSETAVRYLTRGDTTMAAMQTAWRGEVSSRLAFAFGKQ